MPKILCLCFSNLPNFLQMGLQNYSSPMLTGVKLPLFCQFWQKQYMFPKSANVWVALGPLLVSLSDCFVPTLGMLWSRLGRSNFFKICPGQVTCHTLSLTWCRYQHYPNFWHNRWDLMLQTSSLSSRSTRKLANLQGLVCGPTMCIREWFVVYHIEHCNVSGSLACLFVRKQFVVPLVHLQYFLAPLVHSWCTLCHLH